MFDVSGRTERVRQAVSLAVASLPVALLIVCLRAFVVGLYVVPSSSMEPSILPGDLVMGNRVELAMCDPHVGDVITFESPEAAGTTLVKRVVATAGQEVDIRGGRLYVDGVPADEPYAVGRTERLSDSRVSYPHVVAEGCVWVMGDNRESSRDSRSFGDVPLSSVSSRVVLRYWPLLRVGMVE